MSFFYSVFTVFNLLLISARVNRSGVNAVVVLEAQRSYLTAHRAAGHRSHYHNNEIIMNAAARLHQRNIYCIIYSVPWFRENTYKLPAMLFPMHTLSCLPFKAVACSCHCFILHFSRPWDGLLGHCL